MDENIELYFEVEYEETVDRHYLTQDGDQCDSTRCVGTEIIDIEIEELNEQEIKDALHDEVLGLGDGDIRINDVKIIYEPDDENMYRIIVDADNAEITEVI
jgi:hypothetical protein